MLHKLLGVDLMIVLVEGMSRGVWCLSRGRGVPNAQGRGGGSLPALQLWLMLGQGWKLENLPEGRYAYVKRLIYMRPVPQCTLHNSSCTPAMFTVHDTPSYSMSQSY